MPALKSYLIFKKIQAPVQINAVNKVFNLVLSLFSNYPPFYFIVNPLFNYIKKSLK